MTDAHRAQIVEACHVSAEARIVVTHGTDTMVTTGRALAADARLADKTIVLTGAMVPYAFGSSDGLFNLEVRLSFVAGAASRRLRGDERTLLRGTPLKGPSAGVFVSRTRA